MPSPLGHTLAALAIHSATAADVTERRSFRRAAAVTVAALVADADLLLRFVDGRNHHQGMVHSVGFALAAGALTYGVVRLGRPSIAARWALVVALAYGSHLFLDFLSRDTHPPIGLRLFWPFAGGFYKFPWPVFLDVGRSLEWTTALNNVKAGLWEMLLLAPVTLLAWRRAARRRA